MVFWSTRPIHTRTPGVITIFTRGVCTSVPLFKNKRSENTGRIVDLAKGIIDDTHVLFQLVWKYLIMFQLLQYDGRPQGFWGRPGRVCGPVTGGPRGQVHEDQGPRGSLGSNPGQHLQKLGQREPARHRQESWEFRRGFQVGLLNCLHSKKFIIQRDRSTEWSTRPAHNSGRQWYSLNFEKLERTDGRTNCVKIFISTGLDRGRPRGSTRQDNKGNFWFAVYEVRTDLRTFS